MLARFWLIMENTENPENKDFIQPIFLSERFCVYSQPAILMFTFDIKRIEAAQWSLEVQKMLRGIIESVGALSNFIGQISQNKKLYLEGAEVTMTNEMRFWTATYLVDNAVLRMYACLDKLSQMCRCHFEKLKNGGQLTFTQKCKCKEPLRENNCTFGKLLSCLRADSSRDQKIFSSLKEIENNESIKSFRKHRNEFTHGKHSFDSTRGIDPKIKVTEEEEGQLKASISLGNIQPSFPYLRNEIIKANNAIVKGVEEIGEIIFPSDFELKKKIKKS